MKTYQYHSQKFKSDVTVSYNKHGILTGFNVLSGNAVDQLHSHDREFKNFFYEVDFIASAKQHGLKIIEVQRVVTFEMFWKDYEEKNCGRTKAEACWNRMSKFDQVEAYDFIKAFNGILKLNQTAKPYATTYLNSKRWIR
ncbi:hypothetical protein [Aurantibacillus circumpalustris]|uniref:hypothetical protein n=1 Tax=Aurantibacillus circumpalustris TaxID=3036359 RepID=UPI00295A774C|nr:hypothetical protein [Aurantibacillus circumpalustris]